MNLSDRYCTYAMHEFIIHKTYKLLTVMVGNVNAYWTIQLGLIRIGNLTDKNRIVIKLWYSVELHVD